MIIRLRTIFTFSFSCYLIHTDLLIGFFYTILISDDCQEGRRLQYLAPEKLSYITNYLAQTGETDVHSVSTEDDSGKPGSNSAPSEIGFEESSGMTLPYSMKIPLGCEAEGCKTRENVLKFSAK